MCYFKDSARAYIWICNWNFMASNFLPKITGESVPVSLFLKGRRECCLLMRKKKKSNHRLKGPFNGSFLFSHTFHISSTYGREVLRDLRPKVNYLSRKKKDSHKCWILSEN